MTAWKYGGPFRGPKGSTSHTIRSSSVLHPSFSTLPGSTGICQNPENKSTTVQMRKLPILRTTSRMYGMGKLLRLVRRLRALKSMTRRSFSLLGLGTGNQGEAHGVCIDLASPASFTAWNSLRTNFLCAGDNLMGGRCTGSPNISTTKGSMSLSPVISSSTMAMDSKQSYKV
jgi:hypothetical protein